MAQEGMEHWRRAVRWTCGGIFAAALAGGVIGQATGGNPLAEASTRAGQPTTACGAAVSTKTVARGTAALLQLSDLPSGWTAGGTPAAPTRVAPWSPRLAKCVGVPASVEHVAPTKVNSADFTSTDQVDAVEDSVSVYPSAAQAKAEYAALAGTKTTGCMNRVASLPLQKNMQKEAGSATTVGVVSFADLPAGAAALHMTGFTVTIPIARGGRVLTITSTQVDFTSGALLHQMTFNGNGSAFPGVLEEQILSTVQARH